MPQAATLVLEVRRVSVIVDADVRIAQPPPRGGLTRVEVESMAEGIPAEGVGLRLSRDWWPFAVALGLAAGRKP
jgi:hypothetical protein